jgi:hypothetical protein
MQGTFGIGGSLPAFIVALFFQTNIKSCAMKKKNESSGKTRDVNTLLSSKTKPREIDLHEKNSGKKRGSENHKATNEKTAKKN